MPNLMASAKIFLANDLPKIEKIFLARVTFIGNNLVLCVRPFICYYFDDIYIKIQPSSLQGLFSIKWLHSV